MFSARIQELLREAQGFDLIEKRLLTTEEALQRLTALVLEFKEDKINTDVSEIEGLYKERRKLGRSIRNLKGFESEFDTYKKNVNTDIDSLKPIEYINNNLKELILLPELRSFLLTLGEELSAIRTEIKDQNPFSTKVNEEVASKQAALNDINVKIASFPIQTKDFESSVAKFIFIGEVKAKLAFYNREWEEENFDEAIRLLQNEYEDLKRQHQDVDDKRRILLQLLQERIERFISESLAIGDYNKFRAYLDYRRKILQLREPSATNPSHIGSSSNHMFLHLFLFLGLHEHFIREKIPYIPQFLIFDQLSQPYYEEAKKGGSDEIVNGDDKFKLTQAFKLLNDFVGMINNDLKDEFQIILLEHAPSAYWEENSLSNFHLVEEFRNGNALIN